MNIHLQVLSLIGLLQSTMPDQYLMSIWHGQPSVVGYAVPDFNHLRPFGRNDFQVFPGTSAFAPEKYGFLGQDLK